MSNWDITEVNWDDDLNYKGMSKIQIKGKEFIKMIEESLMMDLPETTPMTPIVNQTREEALEEDIRLLKFNDKLLRGRARIYNLEQLLMCLVDKIIKDHC